MDAIQKNLLEQVAELHDVPEGAYNIRANGKAAARNTTANIDIVSKEDKDGIDIIIKPGTKNESVHIPVVLSESGLNETVYNDFIIGDDCDVTIVAGCGIHNCGVQNSEHSGIHTFHVGKRSKVRYVEPQGTYIAWLDFSPLGIGDPANYFFKKANVALTDGRECGEVGRGCVRMNFAMPYPLLEECFDRMAAALEADGLL